MKISFLIPALSCLFVSTSTFSQSINAAEKSYSSLASITPVGEFFFFTLNDDEHGLELWRSDGSTDGTVILSDINPGPGSSAPSNFQIVKSILYFTADDGVHGHELWRSDGTATGTCLVADITKGPSSSSFTFLLSENDHLIFQVQVGENEPVFWISDGTTAGTKPMSDPAGESTDDVTQCLVKGIPSLEESVELNHRKYFVASGMRRGEELWCSEGKRSLLVKDIHPGKEKSFIMCLISTDDALYFSASDGIHGSELWKSDGSRDGTVMLRDIYPGPNSSVPRNLTPFKGKVYFSVFSKTGIELWRTDGTSNRTQKVFPGGQVPADLLTSAFPVSVDK